MSNVWVSYLAWSAFLALLFCSVLLYDFAKKKSERRKFLICHNEFLRLTVDVREKHIEVLEKQIKDLKERLND